MTPTTVFVRDPSLDSLQLFGSSIWVLHLHRYTISVRVQIVPPKAMRAYAGSCWRFHVFWEVPAQSPHAIGAMRFPTSTKDNLPRLRSGAESIGEMTLYLAQSTQKRISLRESNLELSSLLVQSQFTSMTSDMSNYRRSSNRGYEQSLTNTTGE